MGFFDKLKASVGIGGAKIEIHPDETLGFSGESIGVKIVVLGGKIEQKLNCVNLSLLDERPLTEEERAREKEKQQQSSSGSSSIASTKTDEIYSEKLADSLAKTIAPGSRMEFSTTVRIPVMSDVRDHHFKLLVSADIPGAVDPSAEASFAILPRMKGALAPTGRLDGDSFGTLLQKIGATGRDYILEGDGQWRVWFTNDVDEVVALGDLKAVVSMRLGEKVVRTWTNHGVEPHNVVGQIAGEPTEKHGGDAEAFAWAKDVAEKAPVDVLYPDAIGNTYFAIANLRAVRPA